MRNVFYESCKIKVKIIILMLLSYIILFLIYPNLLSYYFNKTNETSILYWGTNALIVVLGSKVSLNIKNWIMGDFFYIAMMWFYTSNNAYGAELDSDFNFKWKILESGINVIILLIFQAVILGLIYLLRKLKQSLKNTSIMLKYESIQKSSLYEKHNKKGKILWIMVLLYVTQFIFFANMFCYYFDTRWFEAGISTESIIIYWGTTTLMMLWGSGVSLNIKDWILGDLIYFILTCVYSARCAYGIGVGSGESLISALPELIKDVAVLLIFQGLVLGVIYLIRKFIMKRFL